ncbi:MAG: recombinase family protein [Chloroflexi bacterium]|nr:recombinase family protein [Chloroflexota bacterium]
MRNIALCYIRKSMVRTKTDAVSPERQRANCLAEAERRGWIAEIYEDAEGHRSGRSEKGRPGWLALRAQLDRPDVAAVIVESLSRASRSVKDLANHVEELQEHDIALISLKETIDTSSAMGRAFVGFIAVMNQFESDITSERMAMTIAFKRESKGQHFGFTPFGCDRNTNADGALVPTRAGVWIVDDKIIVGARDVPPFIPGTRAEWRGYHDALLRCYEWYAEGVTGNRNLCDRLNLAGYRFRDRNGIPRVFDENDVRRLLDANRLYAGYLLAGRAKDKRDAVLREANFAPILPRDLCDRVAATQVARRAFGAPFVGRHSPHDYLLSNLLYCAECGQKMGGAFQDGKMWYRHQRAKDCSCRQVLAEAIDAQVFERLGQFTVPTELKERIAFLARKMMQENGRTDWQEARASMRQLTRKLDNLKELRIDGEIDRNEYARRKAEIETQLRETQKRLPSAPANVQSIEDLIPQVDRIAEVIRLGSVKNKKQLFQTLFKRIEQQDGRITRLVIRDWARPFFQCE